VWRTVERARTQAGGTFRFATHVTAGYWRAHFNGDPVMRASSSGLAHPGPRRTLQAAAMHQQPGGDRGAAAPTSFSPTPPLSPRQWTLREHHACDAFTAPPLFAPQGTVAITDGGVDAPVRAPKGVPIEMSSFVQNAPPPLDHGTAIAGIIAAQTGNSF